MTSSVNNGGSASFDVYQNENFEVAPSSLQSSQPSTVPPRKTVTLLRRDFTYRELVFIFVSFAIAVAAFGLMIGVITEDQAVANEKKMATCTDYDCYVSAAAVQRKMNASVEPCDNFYKYACGQWIDNVKLLGNERERTILLEMERENLRRLNDLIMGQVNPLRDTEWTYESKIKTMFKTCLNQYQTTNLYETNSPLLGQIKEMGGWYAINTFNKSTFNWQKVHRETLGRDNYINVFFDYTVEPVNTEHRKYQITITEDFDLALPFSSSSFLPEYKEFLKNVANLMAEDAFVNDPDLDSRIDVFVNDVIIVEQGISEALMKNQAELIYGNYQRKTLGSMALMASFFDWFTFFSTTFAESLVPITYSTEVIVKCPQTIANLSSYLYNKLPYDQRPRILNNYLVWRLIYSWLPDMSFEYNHLLLNWQTKLSGTSSVEYLPSWTQCMKVAQKYMGEALDGLYAGRHFTHIDKGEVSFISESIRKSLANEVRRLSWMDDVTGQIASEKLSRVLEKIGYPDFMSSDVDTENMLDYSYRLVHMNDTDHFKNMQQLRQHARRERVAVYSTGLDPLSSWRKIPIYSAYSVYYYPWNEVMLSAGLLQFPVFSGYNPAMFRMMTYGSAGYRIARGYLNAVGEAGRYYDKTGKRLPKPWWSNDTVKNYDLKKKCVNEWYSSIKTDYLTLDNGEKVQQQLQDPELYATQAILDIGALRNAFAAYTSSEVQSHPKTAGELFLPGAPAKTRNEYFFLGFAQTFCAARHDQVIYNKMKELIYFLPEELVVNNILMHLPEFSDTFQCPTGSPMNPGGCSAIF